MSKKFVTGISLQQKLVIQILFETEMAKCMKLRGQLAGALILWKEERKRSRRMVGGHGYALFICSLVIQ